MCFSVISPQSFEHIKSKVRAPPPPPPLCSRYGQWVTEWRRYRAETPVVLIGTKKDMRGDPELMRRLAEKGLAPITTAQGATFLRIP